MFNNAINSYNLNKLTRNSILSRFQIHSSKENTGFVPFYINRKLCHTKNSLAEIAKIEFIALHVDNSDFYLLKSLPTIVEENIALEGMCFSEPDNHLVNALTEALRFIATIENAWEIVKEYITTFAYFIPDSNNKNSGSAITSCSLPEFPLLVTFSERALYHIPPCTISSSPSCILFAENIYHESVHHLINIGILTGDLLVNSYNSATSPKIEIPWRMNSSTRNQHWEIDRVLHAAAVYIKLIEWRSYLLKKEVINCEEKECILDAQASGLRNADYLTTKLQENSECFTLRGVDFIKMLRNEYEKYS